MASLREQLRDAVADARQRAALAGDITLPDPGTLPPPVIENPARPEHGDFATNAAMQLAPLARLAPMRIAEALRSHLVTPDAVDEVTIAAPGFINFRLDPAWIGSQVEEVRRAGAAFGRAPSPAPR